MHDDASSKSNIRKFKFELIGSSRKGFELIGPLYFTWQRFIKKEHSQVDVHL